MPSDARTLEYLNEQLAAELTAINQYFLHAKLQEHWGYPKLAAHTRAESIDEMQHAEQLTDRILLLDGLPNYQRLLPLRVGENVPEQFRCDLAIEIEAIDRLKAGIAHMRSVDDVTSARLFEDILADEEVHADYLETQITLIDQLGEKLYLAQLINPAAG